MKNMYVLLILWLYLSFSFSICHSQSMNDKEYVKEINRSFPTHPEDTLCVKTLYSQLSVSKWDKNEVDIYIRIVAKASSQEMAKKIADSLSIHIYAEEEKINCITDFYYPNNQNISFKNLFDIHYIIHVPSNIYLDLYATFGNIALVGDFYNNIYADVKFGDFNADQLYGKNNSVSILYGNANINQIEKLKLSLKFAFNCTSNYIRNLSLNSSQSSFKCRLIDTLNIESQFDKIYIDTLAYIHGNIKQSNIQIATLKSEMNLNLDYSNLKIKGLARDFKKINIDADHSPIDISLHKEQTLLADIEVLQGMIDVKNFPEIRKEIIEHSQLFKGIIGNTTQPTSILKIRNEYGIVKFKLL
jgi:hypothetical protein